MIGIFHYDVNEGRRKCGMKEIVSFELGEIRIKWAAMGLRNSALMNCLQLAKLMLTLFFGNFDAAMKH